MLAAGVAALIVSRPADTPDSGESTIPTTFTIEAEGGLLTFGQQDGEGSLEYSGERGEGRLSFDLDGDGVVTEGAGGRFEMTPGEPPGWPDDLPDPPGATPLGGAVIEAGSLEQLSTTYRTPAPVEEVLTFYRQALAGAQPVEGALGAGEGWLVSFEGTWTGFVTIEADAGTTLVGVQIDRELTSTP